jgi:hypothetical protein
VHKQFGMVYIQSISLVAILPESLIILVLFDAK